MALGKIKTGGARDNKVIVGVIAIVAVILFVVVSFISRQVLATETYYQLKTSVPPRASITMDMVAPVSTKKGTVPKTAATRADIESGKLRSKYDLPAGEIITRGNVGAATSTLYSALMEFKSKEMEDIDNDQSRYKNWVLTSFSVSADNAVGGRISRGDYFDMLVITDTGAFYPFINVKTLDATVSLNSASSGNAADTAEAYQGQQSQYFVKMTPNEAARLQWIVSNYGNIKLVLNDKSDVRTEDGNTVAQFGGMNSYDGYGDAVDGGREEYTPKSVNIAESNSGGNNSNSGSSGDRDRRRGREGDSATSASATTTASENADDNNGDNNGEGDNS